MARNKRKSIKDKEKLKGIRKEAKKRWRKKKAQEKAMKKAAAVATNQAITGNCTTSGKKRNRDSEREEMAQQKHGEPASPRRRPAEVQHHIKEINPSLVVRTEKFLGSGTFGNCYLAYYRDVVVAVKEYKPVKSWTTDDLKKEVRHEAKMISHLGDHCGVPMLFGVVTKSEPLRLITKFHGRKDRSLTLSSAVRKKDFADKSSWLGILRDIIKALEHIHSCGVLHNDLKANNVVLEKRDNGSVNPVLIDFGKARIASDPKPTMNLTKSKREAYQKRYLHIAPEIVCGTGRQSFASDIFSFARIALSVLDLLPTVTARSIKVAKSALSDVPEQRPSLKELLAVL